MLAEARRSATASPAATTPAVITNTAAVANPARPHAAGTIEYMLGDAAELPFTAASFDLVACRLAVHHFSGAASTIAEMARVCKPGGRVMLVDFVSDEDDMLAEEHNRLERLRDPSHTRSLTCAELHALLEQTGTLRCLSPPPAAAEAHDGERAGGILLNEMNLERWMASTKALPSACVKIERSFETELQGGHSYGNVSNFER